jgi:hypothetical protein
MLSRQPTRTIFRPTCFQADLFSGRPVFLGITLTSYSVVPFQHPPLSFHAIHIAEINVLMSHIQ